MPLPQPTPEQLKNGKKGEQAFMSACLSSEVIQREFKSKKQQLGVCFSLYRQAKKKKSKSEEVTEKDFDDLNNQGFYIY